MTAIHRDQVVGTWKLRSAELRSDITPDATLLGQPLGPNPLGRITFTSEGFMTAMLVNPDVAKPLPTPWTTSSEKDIASAARTMTSYGGAYRVFVEDGEDRLATNVDVALDPSYIGTEQVRRLSLREEDGRRVMVLEPMKFITAPGGTKGHAILTWEKL